MHYNNIPNELKQLIQWCVWRYEQADADTKPTKVPYNPVTGRHVSSTNPQTWCSFEQAVEGANDWQRYAGIGFVFSPRDQYCGIDLDYSTDPEIIARQEKIFRAFDSYSERSPSGNGLHIIIKANTPSGKKRDYVEMYSFGRFFTMTGNVFHNAPIAERQELANILYEELKPIQREENGFISDLSQTYDDKVIYDMAASAVNGGKFEALYNGNWQEYYSSQSEADFALINIIAFYTQFTPQVIRMFQASGLGQRAKAKRTQYVIDMVQRSYDNQPPPLSDEMRERLEKDIAAIEKAKYETNVGVAPTPSAPIPALSGGGMVDALPGSVGQGSDPAKSYAPHPSPPLALSNTPFPLDTWRTVKPPGILGMMLDFYMAKSYRPIYEASLAAAIGLFAGIVGRQYNISETGLNLYIMFVAETGKGKEAIASNISLTINQMTGRAASAANIYGPANISSGQALLRFLADREPPCLVSVVGEFGNKLRAITGPKATSADEALVSALLDLFNKSGPGDTLQPTVYSEKVKNTEPLHSPAFTLLGEGVPSRFYEALDEKSVATGLLPRFLIIEYNGNRPPPNRNRSGLEFPQHLLSLLDSLYLHCLTNAKSGHSIAIDITPDAQQKLNAVETYCDNYLNEASTEVLRNIWNRTHFKILRVAGLLAVAHNYQRPVVDALMADWATSLVLTDSFRLMGKFERGEMGEQDETDNGIQINKLMEVIKTYLTTDMHILKKRCKILRDEMPKNYHIPYSYIQPMLASYISFKKDKRGSSVAIRQTINTLIEMGYLSKVNAADADRLYKTTSQIYLIRQL